MGAQRNVSLCDAVLLSTQIHYLSPNGLPADCPELDEPKLDADELPDCPVPEGDEPLPEPDPELDGPDPDDPELLPEDPKAAVPGGSCCWAFIPIPLAKEGEEPPLEAPIPELAAFGSYLAPVLITLLGS